ncbi:hypothetical protein [Burkholderia sp. BE17]|uniref:hypothetical protein n=1 Tax=Burkholderia sp. BE17 TaxID=2656644 RepID=UPI00128C4CB1|nr:hypothetical protein [Burkholderia sp. BE17]MPV71374.1 hypothetical protein [Burkholderia sp. BE17]
MSLIHTLRQRIMGGHVAVLAIAAMLAGLMFLTKPHQVTPPSKNVRITFGIRDLYAPFLTTKENAEVLSSLSTRTKVIATYTHTTHSFHLLGCEVGVGCWPAPHWSEDSTEQNRALPTRIAADANPGAPRAFSVEMPAALEGGYVLSGLYLEVPANTLYQQPSYRSLVKKITATPSALDRDPPDPAFEYLVHFEDYDPSQTRGDDQDCLFLSTPSGFPEIRIPVVVQLSTDSKRMSLERLMHDTCPLVGEDFGSQAGAAHGHLPPSRIAAAQVKIDLEGVHDAARLGGPLPVSEGMTRWFRRSSEGAYADLTEFGPLLQLSMRVRGDNAHPAYNVLPIRTERWTFFNDELVGYSGDIYYDTQAATVEDMNTIHWDQYFHDGKSVLTKMEPTHCDEQGCKDAQAEILAEMSKPYDALQAEARSYVQLRGALRPERP